MSEMTADTVLLVEDEPLVRTVAMIVIEEEIGCRCEIAANRDEALRLLQDHASRIAIVFTDVMMASETDGLELVRIVRRGWPWRHPDELTRFMLPRLLAAL